MESLSRVEFYPRVETMVVRLRNYLGQIRPGFLSIIYIHFNVCIGIYEYVFVCKFNLKCILPL